jgi:hypothetical protein
MDVDILVNVGIGLVQKFNVNFPAFKAMFRP